MNKVLKVATLTFVAIVTINFFTACSKEKDTPSINVEQLYQNINGNYIGTVKLSNSNGDLGSKNATWTANKEVISVKNINGDELAAGIKNQSSKLYQALLNATNGKLEVIITSFKPQEQMIFFSASAKLSFTINLDGQQVEVIGTGGSLPFSCFYAMPTQEMHFNFTIRDLKKSNGRGGFSPLSTDYNLPVTFEFESQQKS
ncbi:hypothetical protein HMPREF9969_0761 [Prevotella sp. oral taxon 306 str. F0472]|uniref:DUF4840 domain-containing protein n=1 Tax=Prevotella sp. oral taxon 306 TaxID=712461 RepID=UPI00025BCDD7|nr:DUF4840 domain-containing protein [Prevotella sp. oral taxon 306]EID34029.1 hypothetical protein HMPREF9969_0761 [Prevotella sp. oral taxon 306 str. F0472]